MGTGDPRPYGRLRGYFLVLFIKFSVLLWERFGLFVLLLPFISLISTFEGSLFMKKRVIIADVDETICETTQTVSPHMAKLVESFISAGHTFAFISGTKESYMTEMLSSQLQGKHFLLPCTGMLCIEAESGEKKTVYENLLSAAERKEVMEALEELVSYFNIITLTTKEDQIQDRGAQITLSPIGRSAPIELKKKLDPDGSKRKIWVAHLKTLLDPKKYDMTIAGTTSIDITRKGLDKGWGIKNFCEHYDIDLQDVLFIGDKTYPGGNDYAATQVVDFISVKNPDGAYEKLKEVFSGDFSSLSPALGVFPDHKVVQ